MATPIFDENGKTWRPTWLGNGNKKVPPQFVPTTICSTLRIYLPVGVALNKYCLTGGKIGSGYYVAPPRGSLSIPPGTSIHDSSLKGNVNLTNLFFEAGADGGQVFLDIVGSSPAEDNLLTGCTELRQINSFPLTYTHIGVAGFYNCSSLIAVDVPGVTSISNKAFYGCSSLQRITFGTNVVSFAGAYEVGKVFSAVPRTCRLEFPGKAPELLIKGTATVSSVEYPYTGIAGAQMFGAKNGIRLYGSWRKDPEGWNKILNEIGSSDWSGKTPPELGDNDRSVRGIFRWANENDTTVPYYGWLIDTKMPNEPPYGMQIIVR